MSKTHLQIVRPVTTAQKHTQTAMDTIVVTLPMARGWKLPPFQRELKVNHKVMAVAEEIKETQVIPGMFSIGIIKETPHIHYLVDGQHRREAFYLSGINEAFLDVRYLHYDSLAEMADEYRKLNGHLVSMTADDMLRSLEESNENLRKLRRACPYIGYANIRRGEKAAIVSMSCAIRCWFGSAPEVPSVGGMSAQDVAENLSIEETQTLITFMEIAFKAWGKDQAHYRLWGNLNLAICMWLYRKLVITPYSASIKKIGNDLFLKCLMSLSADEEYCSWLVGRNLKDRDRSPTYSRIKMHFAKRMEMETGTKPRLPSPAWGGR